MTSVAIALVFHQRCGAPQMSKLSDARHVSCRKHFLCPEIFFSWCIVLFGTSLSGYALLNASRTAANNFDAKWSSRMNTRSAREGTVFASAHLMRKWREQRPSNLFTLTRVSWGFWKSLLHGVDLLLVEFLYLNTWLLVGFVLNGTPCISAS
jgi:hypothetical protein